MEFVGAKVALFYQGKLVVYLRDDKPGLRFSNMWDFPGGGRENDESPAECVIREVEEELGIVLSKNQFTWEKEHPAMHDPSHKGWFLVAGVSKEDIEGIVFGSEGQRWQLMNVEEFFAREDAVPHLKIRLRDYLDAVTRDT